MLPLKMHVKYFLGNLHCLWVTELYVVNLPIQGLVGFMVVMMTLTEQHCMLKKIFSLSRVPELHVINLSLHLLWLHNKPWNNGRNGANLLSLSYPLRPWAIKKSTTGATICCQNAPVAIHHRDIINYRNSYICCKLSFRSYVTHFHNK